MNTVDDTSGYPVVPRIIHRDVLLSIQSSWTDLEGFGPVDVGSEELGREKLGVLSRDRPCTEPEESDALQSRDLGIGDKTDAPVVGEGGIAFAQDIQIPQCG